MNHGLLLKFVDVASALSCAQVFVLVCNIKKKPLDQRCIWFGSWLGRPLLRLWLCCGWRMMLLLVSAMMRIKVSAVRDCLRFLLLFWSWLRSCSMMRWFWSCILFMNILIQSLYRVARIWLTWGLRRWRVTSFLGSTCVCRIDCLVLL